MSTQADLQIIITKRAWRIVALNKLRLIIAAIIGVIVISFVSGCGKADGASDGFQDKDKLSVVTSIYPIYDFTCNIGGDYVEVINLVPAGVEPHDFELSTGDMRLLEQADVFIYNGAGMENFVDKTVSGLSNQSLVVAEAAADVKLIDNGHIKDPHTWLSIENAEIECKAIKNALVFADPDNADYYEYNYNEYIARLDELIKDYYEGLKDCSKSMIVTAHEAFGYLCDEFGLEQYGIEGVMADAEPDASRMKELIDICRDNDIRVVFFEELVSPKVAEAIASETGAETMVLDPIEGLAPSKEQQGLDYIGIMKENLEALKAALK